MMKLNSIGEKKNGYIILMMTEVFYLKTDNLLKDSKDENLSDFSDLNRNCELFSKTNIKVVAGFKSNFSSKLDK